MMRSPTRGSATRALPKPCLRRSTLGVPPRGVRSVGEVFTHITAANCGIAGARGTAPPAGIDLKALTGLFADKKSFRLGRIPSGIFAMPSWPSTTPMPTSRKDVQPPDHPARIFPHDHGTFWRAPRPIHRLRAPEWDPAWTEEAQPQQKPAEKTNP